MWKVQLVFLCIGLKTTCPKHRSSWSMHHPSSVSFAAIEEYTLSVPPRRRASYTGPPKQKPAIKAKPRYSCTSLQLQSAQAQLRWTLDIYDKYNNIMGEFDDIVIGGAGWD